MTISAPRGRPFKKGVSPNPGGKPKELAGLREKIRGHGDELVDYLLDLARNAETENTRVAAIRELLDRGFGKPTQPVDGDGEGGPIHLTIGWQDETEAA